MTKTIYLICGVPGSGKSWVCERVTDKFTYLKHDDHYLNDSVTAIKAIAEISQLPIITECPFAERVTRERLQALGFEVVPMFIVDDPRIIALRYQSRDGRIIPKAHLTRAVTIRDRAIEWGAEQGTSDEILEILQRKEVNHG